jgi:hypothetical protein
MKNGFILILFLVTFNLLFASLKINELCYDPTGSDSGKEWIEIINTSSETIQLFGWKIQAAGTQFNNVYIFSEITDNIAAGQILLIGETEVANADITADLNFQNGGSATDGVRLVSPDGDYTDTVLYDEPNTNNLVDDSGNIATEFCPDVSQGHSLARVQNGVDTNSAIDFFDCYTPTPGETNISYIDIEISKLRLSYDNNCLRITAVVHNLSTLTVDKDSVRISFYNGENLLKTDFLNSIAANDSLIYSTNLDWTQSGYFLIRGEIDFSNDDNAANNVKVASFLSENSKIKFNEIMFAPSSSNSEWIEISSDLENYESYPNIWKIVDESNGEINFENSLQSGYFVICDDSLEFVSSFPNCDKNKIIKGKSWTTLNNSAEKLWLKDEYNTVFDSCFYDNNSYENDVSLERLSVNFPDWDYSISPNGATPGERNSIAKHDYDIKIDSVKTVISESKIEHHIFIENAGLYQIENAELTVSQKDTSGSANTIFSENISLEENNEIYFESDKPNFGYYLYHYKILNNLDENADNNDEKEQLTFNYLPVVINEIMYNPNVDCPEWIEIKWNSFFEEFSKLNFATLDKTISIQKSNSPFVILTSSKEDSLSLRQITDVPIYTGLPALTNSGQELSLDFKNQNVEKFSYSGGCPKGKSLERIQSNQPAFSNNWSSSISDFGSTCGKENSLFIQEIPPKTVLKITPNPFNPRKGEITSINYNIPERLAEINCKIFDLRGRLIRHLVNQEILASTGTIIWDGKDENKKYVKTGIYIILINAVSIDEKQYKKQASIVITF